MGDRIIIRITNGEKWSPDLYCHSIGTAALYAVIKAADESKDDGDPQQMMCNVVLEAMDRTPQACGFYLESHREYRHIDLDNGEWEYNTMTREWTHNYTRWSSAGMEEETEVLTTSEVLERMARGELRCGSSGEAGTWGPSRTPRRPSPEG